MGLLEIIRTDHRAIRRIINEILDARGFNATNQGQMDLLFGLKVEVVANHRAEEAVVYDQFDGKASPLGEVVQQRMDAHNVIEDALEELEEITPEADEWETRVILLKQSLDRHFDREECDLFPQLLDHVSEEELKHMAQLYARLRDEILHTVETPLASHMSPPPAHLHASP